jgi:hypothetical protein
MTNRRARRDVPAGGQRCLPTTEWPGTFLQRSLRKDFRTIRGERHEQVERLGCQMNLAVFPRQLPGVEIEGEWAEAKRQQRPSWKIPAKLLEVT